MTDLERNLVKQMIRQKLSDLRGRVHKGYLAEGNTWVREVFKETLIEFVEGKE
jgi:hypothetical protein